MISIDEGKSLLGAFIFLVFFFFCSSCYLKKGEMGRKRKTMVRQEQMKLCGFNGPGLAMAFYLCFGCVG